MKETDSEDVIAWINIIKERYEKRFGKKEIIYITTECLQRLNQIFTVNSITVLEEFKTIMGLVIIEITPNTKYSWGEVERIKEEEILIDSLTKIYYMKYRGRAKLRQWQMKELRG